MKEEISRVFSYFNNRNVDFNFLYCVAKYPSNSEDLNLSYFSKLKKFMEIAFKDYLFMKQLIVKLHPL